MATSLGSDRRGGAVVELAISTLLVVPMVLYGAWFADVGHWKIKLEEASIGPMMDLTAWRVHDFSGKNPPSYDPLYDTAIAGAVGSARAIPQRMDSSFDSVNPSGSTFRSSVFVVPSRLDVRCKHYENGRPDNTVNYNSAFDTNQSRPGEGVPEFNEHAWVSCRASGELETAGVPKQFKEMASLSKTNPGRHGWASFKICGIGPGVQGCGTNIGLPVMLDDWALSSFPDHEDLDMPLALADYDHVLPHSAAPERMPSSFYWSGENDDYFKLVKRYWRDPAPRAVQRVMNEVAAAEDMGLTDYFHISYRYGKHHAYGDDDGRPQEFALGQSDAYGGPNKDTTAGPNGPPHTGGPWHEEDPTPGSALISRHTYDLRRAKAYMGVQGWPVDGNTSRTANEP